MKLKRFAVKLKTEIYRGWAQMWCSGYFQAVRCVTCSARKVSLKTGSTESANRKRAKSKTT